MVNEKDVIHKIQTDYLKNIPQNCFIQSIPRGIPLDQFNLQQRIALDTLLDPSNNLHLAILLKDVTHNENFEYNNEDEEKINRNPSDFVIESITFKLASALIFISLFYPDEVSALMNQVKPDSSINKSYVIVAFLLAIVCLYIFISFHEQLSTLLRCGIFATGFISMAYLYEVYKTKKKQDKNIEHQFYVSQYLAIKLEHFSTQHLKLEPVEFINE